MPEAKISITSDAAPQEQTQSRPDPKTSPINPTSQISPIILDPSGLAAQLAATPLDPKVQAQARATARKIQQARRQAHATSGVAARYYPVPDGREEVPLLSAADRDLVFSFNPITARQVTRINKLLCTSSTAAPNQSDGPAVIKIKSSTQEERLALAAALKVVKAVLRTSYLTHAVDYIFAPSGLSRELRASTRALLEDLSPRHIIEMARNAELAVYQDAAAEAKDAWGDPVAEGLLVCPEQQQPRKLNAALVKHLIQALGERRKLWPESLRPLIDDLITTLKIMVPSKIPEFIERIIAWLNLSSQALLAELQKLGQQLPSSFAFLPWVQPKAYEQAGGDIHKLLATYLIVPKTRKPKAQAQAQRAAQNKSKAKPTSKRKARKAQPAAEPQAAPTTNAAAPSSVHLELEDLMEPSADELNPVTNQAPASAEVPAAAPDTPAPAPAPAPSEAAAPLSAAAPSTTETEASLAATEAPAPSEAAAPLSAATPSADEAEASQAATEAPAPSVAAAPLSAAAPSATEAEASLAATEAPVPSEAAAPLSAAASSATELSAAEPTNELPRSEAAPSTAEVATATPAIATSEVATAESNDSNASAAPALHVAAAVTERLIMDKDELDELEGLTLEQLEVDPKIDDYPVGLLDSAAFAQTTQAATDLAPAVNGDNQFSCVLPDDPNHPRNEPYLMELEVDSVDIESLGLTGTAPPELSTQRKQDQRNRKQRKADHKRERKLRQAQRRRK